MSGTSDEEAGVNLLEDGEANEAGEKSEASQELSRATQMTLYAAASLSALGDRMWEYTLPLLLTKAWPSSLLPAALYTFTTYLATVLAGPTVGALVDTRDRFPVVLVALASQNLAVLGATVCLLLNLPADVASSESAPARPWSSAAGLLLFAGTTLLGSVAMVASMAEGLAVNKDWPVVLAGPSRARLTDLNSHLTSISLGAKIVVPLLFSLLFMASLQATALVVVAWNCLSFFPEWLLLRRVHAASPALRAPRPPAPPRPNPFRQLVAGARAYYRSPPYLLSLAFVLLFCTILNPGALLNAWLAARAVPDLAIGVFTASASLTGLAAAFLAAPIIKRFGLYATANVALLFQLVCLLPAVVFFLVSDLSYVAAQAGNASGSGSGSGGGGGEGGWRIYVFLALVVVSRLGLWGFDLAERQIMQDHLAPARRAEVFGVEGSLTNVLTMLIYALGIAFSSPDNFFVLVLVSVLMVALSNLLTNIWLCRVRYQAPLQGEDGQPADLEEKQEEKEKGSRGTDDSL